MHWPGPGMKTKHLSPTLCRTSASQPFCSADSAKRGEPRRRAARALMTDETRWKNFARQTAPLDLKCNYRHCRVSMPVVDAIFCTRKMESLAATRRWWWPNPARNPVPETRSWLRGQKVPNRRDWISCFANSTKNREAPQFRRREKVLAYGHHPSALTNHAPSIYSLQIGCPINSLPYFRLFQRGHFS